MKQPNRKNSGGTNHLASINFPEELLLWIDEMAKTNNMTRTGVVCLMLNDYMKAGKKIEITIN